MSSDKEKAYRRAYQHEYQMRVKYGIDTKGYKKLLDEQNGVCAICFEVPKTRLVIDHDHSTGQVRGLLCYNCNSGLGMFKDDKFLLASAYRYLESLS
jgi:formate dehydrogenase maturation protein FdhE